MSFLSFSREGKGRKQLCQKCHLRARRAMRYEMKKEEKYLSVCKNKLKSQKRQTRLCLGSKLSEMSDG